MRTHLPKKAQLYPTPNFRPMSCLFWPTGWMDQGATWYEGRPRPRPHCVRSEPSSPPPKKGHNCPIFGPCLLCLPPNVWMDQDRPTTWYKVGLGPGDIVLDRDPASPPHRPSIFGPCMLWRWPNGWSGWIKMPLGMELRRPRPCHVVLDGDPAAMERGTAAPTFRPISIVAKRSPISATAEVLSSCTRSPKNSMHFIVFA